MQRTLRIIGILAAASALFAASPIKLLNVSYDPTRELYQDINAAFAKQWKAKTGADVQVSATEPDRGGWWRAPSNHIHEQAHRLESHCFKREQNARESRVTGEAQIRVVTTNDGDILRHAQAERAAASNDVTAAAEMAAQDTGRFGKFAQPLGQAPRDRLDRRFGIPKAVAVGGIDETGLGRVARLRDTQESFDQVLSHLRSFLTAAVLVA